MIYISVARQVQYMNWFVTDIIKKSMTESMMDEKHAQTGLKWKKHAHTRKFPKKRARV